MFIHVSIYTSTYFIYIYIDRYWSPPGFRYSSGTSTLARAYTHPDTSFS